MLHVVGGCLSHAATEIPFNHMQCQIDSGCESARAGDSSVIDETYASLHIDLRKFTAQFLGKKVVRGG